MKPSGRVLRRTSLCPTRSVTPETHTLVRGEPHKMAGGQRWSRKSRLAAPSLLVRNVDEIDPVGRRERDRPREVGWTGRQPQLLRRLPRSRDEVLEPGWAVDLEYASRRSGGDLVRVGHPGWAVRPFPGTAPARLAGEVHGQLALEDVPELALSVVDVQRGALCRWAEVLEEGEAPLRVLARHVHGHEVAERPVGGPGRLSRRHALRQFTRRAEDVDAVFGSERDRPRDIGLAGGQRQLTCRLAGRGDEVLEPRGAADVEEPGGRGGCDLVGVRHAAWAVDQAAWTPAQRAPRQMNRQLAFEDAVELV